MALPPNYSYRATVPIDFDNVRAYNVGDLVPDENVKLHGYDKLGMVKAVEVEVEKSTDGTPGPKAVESLPKADETLSMEEPLPAEEPRASARKK